MLCYVKEKFSHGGILYIFVKKSADQNRKMWHCKRKDYSCHQDRSRYTAALDVV